MITKIDLDETYKGKIRMREALYRERTPLPFQAELLAQLPQYRYRELVTATMSGDLSLSQAFAAACFALRASNSTLAERYFSNLESFGIMGDCMAAREMLSGLAMKESWGHLHPEEVAGLVTAAMLDVMDFASYGRVILETCGMGGDRGVLVNGDTAPKKTINASTLSALTVATLGYPTAKHGSYSNTSRVGSTDAIEKLGLIVDIQDRGVQTHLAHGRFHFTDAHAWKTIHDLSHLQPRRETVNHVIGPMTPPIGPEVQLNKILGVNAKMHPETIARAYTLLHHHHIFTVGNVAVVCGLSQKLYAHELGSHHRVRDLAILDELSPFGSVVAFTRGDEFLGNFVLSPADFGVTFQDPFSVFIPNEQERIMQANRAALGMEEDRCQFTEFLAMNAALGLYLTESMDEDKGMLRGDGPSRDALHTCYKRCYDALTSHEVSRFLEGQVELTHHLASSLP